MVAVKKLAQHNSQIFPCSLSVAVTFSKVCNSASFLKTLGVSCDIVRDLLVLQETRKLPAFLLI